MHWSYCSLVLNHQFCCEVPFKMNEISWNLIVLNLGVLKLELFRINSSIPHAADALVPCITSSSAAVGLLTIPDGAKTLGSTSIRYWADVEVPDRCLIYGDPMAFNIWAAAYTDASLSWGTIWMIRIISMLGNNRKWKYIMFTKINSVPQGLMIDLPSSL